MKKVFYLLLFLFIGFIVQRLFVAEPLVDKVSEILGSDENVIINFYRIEGGTTKELLHSMDLRGPVDEDGERRYAYTRWQIDWNWPSTSDDQPNYVSTTASYRITVTLPDWNKPKSVDKEVINSWEKYFIALVKHERGHVNHVRDNYQRVAEEIRFRSKQNPELDKKQVNKIADNILDQIRVLDREYDRQTSHGKTQGVRFEF